MNRRLVRVSVVAAVAIAALNAIQAADALPAPRGVECNISGAASISPGLAPKATPQSVTLSDIQLKGCRMGSTASAGVPTTVTGWVSTSPNPAPSKGGCANGSLQDLTANITWSTGTSASVSFSTTSVTGETAISGSVLWSTEPALEPGDIVAGDVVFTPTTTKQNCAKNPVTNVTFTGVIVAGAPK